MAFIASALMAFAGTPMPSVSAVPVHTASSPHSPISINSNSDFVAQASSNSWSGDGSAATPYIIENYMIDAATYSNGISISNTIVHFIIANCTIQNATGNGILLTNVTNAMLDNNSCSLNNDGIYVDVSSHITLTDNNCGANSDCGLILDQSSNNTLSENNCSYNVNNCGIDLYGSNYNLMDNNSCVGNSIGIYVDTSYGDTLADNICFENYDGIYAVESDNLSLVGNVCNNNTQAGPYTGVGILGSGTDNLSLVGNICNNNSDDGIYIELSRYILMADNICNNNSYDGVYADYSNFILMTNNVCNDNHGDSGIWTTYVDNVTAIGNICNSQPYGLYVDNFRNCYLANNTCNNSTQEGLFVGIGDSHDGIVINNTCNGNLEGIYLDGFDHGIFVDNICINNTYGIYVDTDSDFNLIDNNNCTGNVYNGICLSQSTNNTLSNNICNENSVGINLLAGCNDNILLNNTCKLNVGVDGNGIAIFQSGKVRIISNTCGLNLYDGIYVDTSNNATLIDNNCSSNEWAGIVLKDSENATLSGGNCSSNPYGIRLQGAIRNNMVVDNDCYDNSFDGIFLSASRNNTLANNTCTYNDAKGIEIVSSSYDNIIFNNNCSMNQNGIQIDSSSRNVASWNSIFDNTFHGIYIAPGCNLNMICNNTFIHNNGVGIQANDDGSNNRWNTSGAVHGYGNYWSDLTSPDLVYPWKIVDYSYNLSGGASAKDYYPLTIIPDNTPPTTNAVPTGTIGENGWYVSGVTLSLSATDIGSGVNATYFRNGTSGAFTAYSSPIAYSVSGSYLVQFYSVDNFTNVESVKGISLKIDKELPSGSISINSGNACTANASVKISIGVIDSGSGLNKMRLSNDGVTWTSWQSIVGLLNWTLTAGDGTKIVYCEITDNANLSIILNDTIVCDTTAPTLTLNQSNGLQVTSDYVVISWGGSDATSGIDHFEVSIDGSAFTSIGLVFSYNFTGLTDGSHNVTVKAIDAAGNDVSKSIQFNVDTSVEAASYTILILIIIVIVVGIIVAYYVLIKRKKKGQVV